MTEVLERASDGDDRSADWTADWAAWQAAGLTALPLPEEAGGDGLGLEAEKFVPAAVEAAVTVWARRRDFARGAS